MIVAVEPTNVNIEQLLSSSRAIYIIDSTGILLHHEFFLGQNEDPDLYSGLFAAVNVYAKELNAGEIKTVKLDNYKFIFSEEKESGFLIVLDVFREMPDANGEWLLAQIVKRFDAMKKLLEEDFKGSLTLTTLFDDRGKQITWNTIHAIREDAIENQKLTGDKVDTLNITKITIRNKNWVKIRNLISTMVESQIGLIGMVLFIRKEDHTNILYSGRDPNQMKYLQDYISDKMQFATSIELETELIKIEDMYCALYPLLLEDGGTLGISSDDKYLVARLNNQIERVVASLEKIGISE